METKKKKKEERKRKKENQLEITPVLVTYWLKQ